MEFIQFEIRIQLRKAYLHLHPCDVTDGKPKESSQRHEDNEMEWKEFLEREYLLEFSSHDNQWHEQDESVYVVVKGQKPETIFN